ncbi:MAG: acylneuraminate cytidylyltransferase family protein [Candidatus Margulisiibacteriota bacterium]|jgi:CMP-N-acetylneuraminic acid synthetase
MVSKKILGIILARGGSKGIPKKNIYPLCGKPLIAYSIEASVGSKYISKTVVSSDDDEILSVSKRFGADTIKRPIALAADDSSSASAIKHAIDFLKAKGELYDILLLLQPTSPLRNSLDIDNAIMAFLNHSQATSLISVYEPQHSPFLAFKETNDGYLESLVGDNNQFLRRQDLPKTYFPNGAIYIIFVNDFLDTNLLFTNKTIPFLMNKLKSIDIDTLEDLKEVENIMKNEK